MNQKENSFLIAGSVFTISTTIGQVISIDNNCLKLLIAVPNIIAWVYVVAIYLFSKSPRINKGQLKRLAKLFPKETIIAYSYVDSLPDLRNIWQQDSVEYKELNIDFKLLRAWWEKNNKGIYIGKEGNSIQSSIGIWPITSKFFDEILARNETDESLMPGDIISVGDEGGWQYWYISGLWSRASGDILPEFLGESFKSLMSRIVNEDCNINIAIAPMVMEETFLLDMLGFMKMTGSKDGKLSIYYYSKKDLNHMKAVVDILLNSKNSIDAYENK